MRASSGRRANVSCRRQQARRGDVFAGLDQDEPPPPEALAAYAQEVVPILREGIEEIGDLEPPRRGQQRVARILGAYATAIDIIEADPNRLATGEDPFKASDMLAKNYGLEDCASD